jgi:hypothetical protein
MKKEKGYFDWTPRLFGLLRTRSVLGLREAYLKLGRLSVHCTIHKK